MIEVIGQFAHSLGGTIFIALISFVLIGLARRSGRSISIPRRIAVFFVGWIGGSFVTLLVRLFLALLGADAVGDGLQGVVGAIAVFSVMFVAFTRLSKPRTKETAGEKKA